MRGMRPRVAFLYTVASMRMVFRTGVALLLVCSATVAAMTASPQVSTPAQPAPAPQIPAPAPQQPSAPAQPGAIPAPVVPAVPVVARSFTAPTGVIFNVVRPERVVDFELVIGYLQAALEKSTNAQVREQAKGWRMFKATEPGPNGTVLYVFLMDPAVPKAEYALGPILSEAYPDQIEQIWKLYQGALAGAGSQTLLNLAPVKPPPLPPPGTAPTEAPPADARPAPPK